MDVVFNLLNAHEVNYPILKSLTSGECVNGMTLPWPQHSLWFSSCQ